MEIVRFSVLLRAAMEDYGVGPCKLHEILEDHGITNIKFRRISEYIHEIATPPFDKAKVILKILEYEISDEDLNSSLVLNRQLIRENKEEQEFLDEKKYNKSVKTTVKLRHICPGTDTLDAENRLKLRIKELLGDEEMVNEYVEKLIAEDLQKSVLQEEKQ